MIPQQQQQQQKKGSAIVFEQMCHEMVRMFSHDNSLSGKARTKRRLKDGTENDLGIDLLNAPVGDEDNFAKLDAIGFSAGHRFIGKFTLSHMNKGLIGKELDIIKFFCKDFWEEVFGKKIDKLQTNHRGEYMLHDNNFVMIRRLSIASFELSGDKSDISESLKFLAIPCGLIRGALSNLGIETEVQASIPEIPKARFSIRVLQ